MHGLGLRVPSRGAGIGSMRVSAGYAIAGDANRATMLCLGEEPRQLAWASS